MGNLIQLNDIEQIDCWQFNKFLAFFFRFVAVRINLGLSSMLSAGRLGLI